MGAEQFGTHYTHGWASRMIRVMNSGLAEGSASVLEYLIKGYAHDIRNFCHQAAALNSCVVKDVESGQLIKAVTHLGYQDRSLRDLWSLCEKLLDLSSARSNQYKCHNLWRLVHGVVTRFELTLRKETSVEAYVEMGAFVHCDEIEVAEVVVNLLKNAKQASGLDRKCELAVIVHDVRSFDSDNYKELRQRPFVGVSVVDNAGGMAEEVFEQLGRVHFSTKPRTKQSGSGLGLFMCSYIANKHDGIFLVRTKPGQGSVFTLYLPAVVLS